MAKPIGTVVGLWHYRVKSMSGESVPSHGHLERYSSDDPR